MLQHGSDPLVIGFDMSNGQDVSCLIVSRYDGMVMTVINEFYGEDAAALYLKLTTVNKIEARERKTTFVKE